MESLRLNDLVRGTVEDVTIDLRSSVSDALEVVISDLGLPRYDLDGTPITYELRAGETERALPASDSLSEAGVATGGTIELISPNGGAAWDHVRRLSLELRRELDAGLRRGRAAVRSGVRSEIQKMEGAVRREVRATIRSATQDIEAEVGRRLRRTGRRLGFWARRRVRRLTRQLQATGALPGDVDALALATGQLRSVAQAALVVPLAGVAAVAAVAGGGGLYLATTAGDSGLEELRARMHRVELRAEKAAAIGAAAAASARDAANLAVAASVLVEEHIADVEDPHEIAVLATIDAHVRSELDADARDANGASVQPSGAEQGWVAGLLSVADRRADGRIDAHLSTAYVAVPGARAIVDEGDSLWDIAVAALRREPGRDHGCEAFGPVDEPTIGDIVDYVSGLWIANVGVIRDDADVIEVGTELQLVCPSPSP